MDIVTNVKETETGLEFEVSEEIDTKLKEIYGTDNYEEQLSKDFERWVRMKYLYLTGIKKEES